MPAHQQVERELWDPSKQSMPAGDIARMQKDLLEREWQRVWEQPIPFYAAKYKAAGLGPGKIPPLDEIPLTRKDELRADDAAHPPFGTWRSVSLEQATAISASTGTTAKPMIYLRTLEDSAIAQAATARTWWRMKLRPGGRMAHAWPQGLYLPIGIFTLALRDFPAMEIAVGPPFSVDAAIEHLNVWKMLKPTAYQTTGSQLQLYEAAAAKIGIDLADLFQGTSMAIIEATCQFEGPRRRFEERYGVQIFNISGASELAAGSLSDCRFHTGFHVHSDFQIAQVCDPKTGKELKDGERGHLVWTSLGASGFWMRYDVEDVVEKVPGTCPCGETGARYRLFGRSSDIFRTGDRSLFPLDIQLALDEHGAPEFAMMKSDTNDGILRLKLETDGSVARFVEILQSTLGVKVQIEPVSPGSLPRSTFKPKRT